MSGWGCRFAWMGVRDEMPFPDYTEFLPLFFLLSFPPPLRENKRILDDGRLRRHSHWRQLPPHACRQPHAPSLVAFFIVTIIFFCSKPKALQQTFTRDVREGLLRVCLSVS